ncbi:MAG: GNAT family N-acetyltransferase [Actinobacteria bacterium]|nr:GNAT family N-acetyltransferase [Actinomycetota bacterium]
MSVELHPPRLDETADLAALANRYSGELYDERDESGESVKLWLTGPDLNPETDARVAVRGGELMGYADLGAHPDPKYWADLRVPPSEDDDVRILLLRWLEERASERVAGRAGGLLRCFAWSVDEAFNRLLEASGYELIRHSYRMQIEFGGDVPEPRWPEGIAVRPAAEGDFEAAYEANQESFEDSWEHTRDPFDEWSHWMTSYEGFDPSLWFLAEEGGELAGVCLCRLHEADERLGFVRVLGVRRPWRRRGLGRALLLHSFHEFLRRGTKGVGLGVDADSLTGADLLYEDVGMRIVRQSNIWDKPLS